MNIKITSIDCQRSGETDPHISPPVVNRTRKSPGERKINVLLDTLDSFLVVLEAFLFVLLSVLLVFLDSLLALLLDRLLDLLSETILLTVLTE